MTVVPIVVCPLADGGFDVWQGGAHTERLTFGEMVEHVTALAMQHSKPRLHDMRTPHEIADRDARREAERAPQLVLLKVGDAVRDKRSGRCGSVAATCWDDAVGVSWLDDPGRIHVCKTDTIERSN